MVQKSVRTKTIQQPVASVTWQQVMAWRMRRHGLQERQPQEQLFPLVERIGGLHAQLMSSAELMLWARVEGVTSEQVQQALWEERTLVKTWAMRGTLHLMPAREYPLWQAALSLGRMHLRPSWQRYFGITLEEMEPMLAAIAQALDGKLLTREELADEVARLTGLPHLKEKLISGWGTTLKPAARAGYLCFGPNQGQNIRFTNPVSWLRHWEHIEPEQAQREITRRYLAAYGPATAEDYAHWWGMSPAAARSLIKGLGEEVTLVDLEGVPAWLLSADLTELTTIEPAGVARLLPAFDQYVIAASPHLEQLMPGDFRPRIYRPQGWVSPVLLVDGRMDGIWQFEHKGSKLNVRIEPFVELPQWVRQAAEAEAQHLATFTGGTLDFQIG